MQLADTHAFNEPDSPDRLVLPGRLSQTIDPAAGR